MRKNNYQIYFVLALGLLLLFAVPARVQNVLRSQFLRPILPFGYLIPKKNHKLPKNYPSQPVEASTPFRPSHPNGSLAKILYRNPSTWNDFFWIDLGEASNQQGSKIVLNSPVLYDGSLIGIIDYVGKKQSRVQLITNSNLTISVRALRGENQYLDLHNHLEALLSSPIIQEAGALQFELSKLKNCLQSETQNWYLAKGEIYGASEPLWRSKSHLLLGRGFNCENGDEKGVQRDLITGKSLDALEREISILKRGDLLITTGLDGVFPEGLQVARVTEVEDLTEGSFAYSLKARPIAPSLNDLQYVEVILPVEYKYEKVSLKAFSN